MKKQVTKLTSLEALGKAFKESRAQSAHIEKSGKSSPKPKHPPATILKAPAPAPEERKISDDEIFREAMSDVREIEAYRQLPLKTRRPHSGARKPRKDDALDALRRLVERKEPMRISDTSEYVEWVFPGSRPDIPSRLHDGEFAVQDHIDLHGLTAAEAEAALGEFLAEARRKGLLCVKVIHGRGLRSPGEPVLKAAVTRLLKGPMSKYVRAYATARPCDGGLGATYVMLKGK